MVLGRGRKGEDMEGMDEGRREGGGHKEGKEDGREGEESRGKGEGRWEGGECIGGLGSG